MTVATLPVVTTRPANASDERLLRSLFADTRDDLFLLDPDVRNALLDMQFRAQRRQLELDRPNAERLVLLVDGVGVGSLVVDNTTDGVDVLDLMVTWSRRGRGIATSVLSGVLSVHGVLRSRVVSGDPALRGLSSRLGLRVEGEPTCAHPPARRAHL